MMAILPTHKRNTGAGSKTLCQPYHQETMSVQPGTSLVDGRGISVAPISKQWNELPEHTVMAPTLNSFKSRLNKCWHGHPHKFNPWCYIPGERTRHWQRHPNTSTEVAEPN